MTYTAGIDVGSTYTKVALLGDDGRLAARAMAKTGFRLAEVSRKVFDQALEHAGARESDVAYTISTGYGRFQVPFRSLQVTDLSAAARGGAFFFPATRTVLDVGGQTMKASRLDGNARVKAFRLNDKCAAGTGAFLEKTARYLGYTTEEIGALASVSHDPVPISGVCAVFAESEVINHLSLGAAAADIMQGAIVSLVHRSVQLMKRVQMEPEFTLVGGILRFPSMASLITETLGAGANVPPGDMAQYAAAIGAAVMARRRLSGAQTTGANARASAAIQS